MIAIIVASLAVKLFGLPVETIGTRFGGIPGSLPLPALPPLSPEKALAVLPDAASFALLGAIESLLSAMVADGMTGRRHRSNMELVAQGVANFVSPLFGGICVTGTVARTATNVRAGATSPVASMAHALFVLLLMLVAAPLASYIPLAGLAGVLAVVCWNMADKHEVLTLLRTSKADAFVLIVTFGLTVFRGLTEAIIYEPNSGQVLAAAGLFVGMGVEPPPQSATQQALAGDVAVLNGGDGTRVRAVVKLDSTPPLVLMIGRPIDPMILGYMQRTEQAVSEYQRLDDNRSWLQIAFAWIFAIVALLVLLASSLIGLVMANQIVRPIGALINAAERVRAGDLGVRVAEVATKRTRPPWSGAAPCARISATYSSIAANVRASASGCSSPAASTPWPRRTIRASRTRSAIPCSATRPTSSLMVLVPQSIAATGAVLTSPVLSRL